MRAVRRNDDESHGAGGGIVPWPHGGDPCVRRVRHGGDVFCAVTVRQRGIMGISSRGASALSAPETLTFDRKSGRLAGASLLDRATVLALQAGSVATEPFGHHGFVDCGANFGYWSVLASSKPFGAQQAIAIEAGGLNVKHLNRNAELNGNRFRCLHAAIAGGSGFARVTGTSHEKLETVPVERSESGAVKTVSLDGLAEMRFIDASRPLVVKLDVEGVEIEALRGGRGVLAGECLVICEEHGSDRKHSVSRYLMEENSLSLIVFDPAVRRFVRLDDLRLLDRMKRHRWVGYNVFATSGRAWKECLLSACSLPAGWDAG